MKKILLTSIVGLMALVPNMANARVAWGVLLDSLAAQSDTELNKEKFTEQLEAGKEYNLTELVPICLKSCADSVDKVHVCMRLINDIDHRQGMISRIISSHLNNYIAHGIQPDNNRFIARSDDGKYVAAYVHIPDELDFSRYSKTYDKILRDTVGIFDANTLNVQCVINEEYDSSTCMKRDDSNSFFVVTIRDVDISSLRVFSRDAYPKARISVGLSAFPFYLDYVSRDDHYAHHLLKDYDWNIRKEEKEDRLKETARDIAYKYRDKRFDALYECLDKMLEDDRFHTLRFMRSDGQDITKLLETPKETCENDKCTITLSFVDLHYSCDYPRYDMEYLDMIKQYPEFTVKPFGW